MECDIILISQKLNSEEAPLNLVLFNPVSLPEWGDHRCIGELNISLLF
jgi:hypothetical protein